MSVFQAVLGGTGSYVGFSKVSGVFELSSASRCDLGTKGSKSGCGDVRLEVLKPLAAKNVAAKSPAVG